MLCALSVAVLGVTVWRDFLFYHLPHVQSGEALRFLAGSPREIAMNLAPFGVVFKLRALGLVDWSWPQARLVGSVYTGLLVVLTALAARNNKGGSAHRLTVWLAITMLASLRSPYAAPFVATTVVVLLMVLFAEVRARRHLAVALGAWVLFSVPTPSSDPQVEIAASLARLALIYVFLVWAALRRDAVAPAPT